MMRQVAGEGSGAAGGILEAKKSYTEILEQEITEGLRQFERPTLGLLLSAFSAGLDVGFSLLLMAVMWTLVGGTFSPPATELLVANMYSVGFIFVIMGRSELFTEHTTTAVLPVLHGRATLRQLAKLWGLVYVANIAGAAIFAALAAEIGPALGVIEPAVFGRIAHGLLAHSWPVIVFSGVFAGWLMGLLSWLVTASRDTVSQVLLIWLITTAIGFSHLHHSVAGTVEVLAGIFARQGVNLFDYAYFMSATTLGNAIGAVCFVAILKYSHAKRRGGHLAPVKLDEPSAIDKIMSKD